MGTPEYPQPYGDYVLLERLGVGGMSEVDLARKAVQDTDFVRFVVIKRIKADLTDDESFVRMFKDEARITAELHHNNIANVYDFGRHGDEYYMALEYVPGTDLRRIINTLRKRHQTIPLRIGLKILADMLSGLGYAHDQVDAVGQNMNIVHRDVNPRNVMISTRGEVKLIDFGVAKAANRLERTRTDHVKGKFAYMAPEQITAGEIDHRADLFAVGLMLHEVVTGYGPLAGLSQVQIMHRLMAGRLPELPPPSELADPKPLQRVYSRAIAVKPENRYPSAAALRRDLEEVAEPLGGLVTRQELVAFLQQVDPALEDRLREKASSYSGPLQPSQVATAPLRRLETLEP
ncbi:MAG: serine/threonine protein kinase, partial [Deltaproteobacteria bacterium]|nr:serine/threonine protein kinase [Deltaproteobacteria bacterium]